MEFDHNWEPGENDGRTRRWVRRVAFVLVLVVVAWIVAIVSGGDAKGEDNPKSKSQVGVASSTYRPKVPLKPATKWDSDKLYMTAGFVDLAWKHASSSKRADLCALMKTGYQEKAVRSLPEGDDAYERSFELDKNGDVDWYFAAQLLEVKCLRTP